MKADVTCKYRYVKIDDYYFCLQQNPAVLIWILFFKREDLITIQPWLKMKNMPRWRKICSRYYWHILKRNLKTLLVFAQCRLNLRKLDTVQLPVYGQFGMSVHKGYKIFDLRGRVVSKVFDSDVNMSTILGEIEQLKKISPIDFAPSLTKWNISERWYREDYFKSKIAAAHRSADSTTLLKAFYQEAVPCMNSLILLQRPVTKGLGEYINELIEILNSGKLSEKSLDSTEASIYRNFVHAAVERLHREEGRPVHLVFSHGDFCPANFLNTADGLRIVDWETATHRSLLFDFYSYFFYRVTTGKLPVDQIVSEICEALPKVISGLSLRMPDLSADILSMAYIYRWLFYIEYLCKLVERDVTDNRLNMTDYMMKYIKAFRAYEDTKKVNVMAEKSTAKKW